MKLFFLSVLAFALISCFEQGDCSDVSSNVMQLDFYRNSDSKKLLIKLDSVKIIGWDTVMYEADSIGTVKLPLNPAVDTMTYVFYYYETQASLGVKYNFKTFALAPDCNAIDLIMLQEVSAITIQKLTISQPKLTNTTVENIKLYF
jgi:hypothetical protein